jgi:hypothetical protein
MRNGLVALTLLMHLAFAIQAQDPDRDYAAEGTIRLSIPEPLIFDLVRPLGARKGEVEINTLFRWPRGETLEWAPEVEVVVGRGIGIEFELPAEGSHIAAYKFAVQGLLPTWRAAKTRYVQGWQAIAEIPQDDSPTELSALYISGLRWTERVSSLSLNGLRVDRGSGRTMSYLLLNNTLFYETTRGRTVGLESNLRLRPNERAKQFVPQLHQPLPRHFHVQVGFGATRAPDLAWRPVLAWRIIRELN